MGTKEPVRLRKRRTPAGNVSLYLDIYLGGVRRYEYLRLYLVPEVTRADREKNRETLRLAEAVQAKRLVEVRNGQFGFADRTNASKVLFFDFYESLMNKSTGRRNWLCALHHLRIYERRQNVTLADITPEWIDGFKDYLEHRATAWTDDGRHRGRGTPLRKNTRAAYFGRLHTCVRAAVGEGLLAKDPMHGITGIAKEEGTRMYLTVEELRSLVCAECDNDGVRRAFLFSCLTGLRRSDIMRLTWGEVFQQGSFTRLIFKQKKTNGLEYLDLTPQALPLMGERGRADAYVFEDFPAPGPTNETLARWMLRARIGKHITFHCARHTFAVMMLDLGTDLYTVSKLLGHRDIATTQIYAKVLDKNKQAAVSRIPSILI